MLLVLLVVGLFCKDVWGSNIAGCSDIDTSSGVYDNDGRECDFYDAKPDQCGKFDNDEFESARLCCACKGGVKQGSKSSTTTFRGTLPPRQTIGRTSKRIKTTAPPRQIPRGGEDTTKETQPGAKTRAPRNPNSQNTGSTTRLTRPTPPTPPTRKPGCFGFDAGEMKRANCDPKNEKNCYDFMPGSPARCHFTCVAGYIPPPGGKEQLYMLCDEEGKWHANAKCVAPARPTLKGQNITKVSGDCGGHAWEHSQDISRCALQSGTIAVELWISVGIVFLLIIALVIGIICCVKKTNSANYSGSMAIQLGNSPSKRGYDWSLNPEKYEKM